VVDERRCSADGAEGAYGRVHAARKVTLGALLKSLRSRVSQGFGFGTHPGISIESVGLSGSEFEEQETRSMAHNTTELVVLEDETLLLSTF
jgi:hypothetical protein